MNILDKSISLWYSQSCSCSIICHGYPSALQPLVNLFWCVLTIFNSILSSIANCLTANLNSFMQGCTVLRSMLAQVVQDCHHRSEQQYQKYPSQQTLSLVHQWELLWQPPRPSSQSQKLIQLLITNDFHPSQKTMLLGVGVLHFVTPPTTHRRSIRSKLASGS